jgi:hypothetical protein
MNAGEDAVPAIVVKAVEHMVDTVGSQSSSLTYQL